MQRIQSIPQKGTSYLYVTTVILCKRSLSLKDIFVRTKLFQSRKAKNTCVGVTQARHTFKHWKWDWIFITQIKSTYLVQAAVTAGGRSWTKGLISAVYSSENVWFSCRWEPAGVSFNGLLWSNIWSISPLFGLRDPLKGKPASSNRFDSVKRLSVAKRLLLWQKSQVVEKRESLKNGGVQSEISSISRSCLRTGTSSRCNGRHNFKLPGSRSICSMKIIEEAVGIRKNNTQKDVRKSWLTKVLNQNDY